MRYAGSSLDYDMRFVFQTLDQRTTVGSDFPEYPLADARQRVAELLRDVPEAKQRNILHGNLERFLGSWLERR
jgi:predicted TIM-barrel fold metal-dependent hydrolase